LSWAVSRSAITAPVRFALLNANARRDCVGEHVGVIEDDRRVLGERDPPFVVGTPDPIRVCDLHIGASGIDLSHGQCRVFGVAQHRCEDVPPEAAVEKEDERFGVRQPLGAARWHGALPRCRQRERRSLRRSTQSVRRRRLVRARRSAGHPRLGKEDRPRRSSAQP
jgi:hypothetical protein